MSLRAASSIYKVSPRPPTLHKQDPVSTRKQARKERREGGEEGRRGTGGQAG